MSQHVCYPVWIHCCRRSNYNFCISHSSLVTVLKWGGQNYSHLCQVFSWCCVPIVIKIGLVSWSYSKNKSGTFLRTTVCYYCWRIDNYRTNICLWWSTGVWQSIRRQWRDHLKHANRCLWDAQRIQPALRRWTIPHSRMPLQSRAHQGTSQLSYASKMAKTHP